MKLDHQAQRSGRLSSFLREEMKLSAGLMNRLKWQDRLFVNGVARHTDFPVHPGDRIEVLLDEPVPEYPGEDLPLSVLYEDEWILAVDKPAGMLIHPSRACFTGTLANRVVGYYQRTGQPSAFHPVTRLDRDTFGVVLLGKSAHIHHLLHEQHRAGSLQKIYHGLVYGRPEQQEGQIDAPIARRELPSLLRYVHPAGKPSLTRYRLLEALAGCSLLELQPVTGRTHQLRVHCAYAGFPILGDPQYGTEESAAFSKTLGLTYQMLCARAVRFVHPITGAQTEIVSRFDGKSGIHFQTLVL